MYDHVEGQEKTWEKWEKLEASIDTSTLRIDELTHSVISCCYKVHSTLGFGFLESVYKNALLYEMGNRGLVAEEEVPLAVRYGSAVVGNFYADIIVDGRLIVELKAVEILHLRHEVQLVNYLAATGIEDGLLVNFGPRKVDVKRKFRTPVVMGLFLYYRIKIDKIDKIKQIKRCQRCRSSSWDERMAG